MCSVCSVHSLTGFAEVLCTETCSLSLQIGISFEFIEFPWLKHLQICQQGLLQQSICYQIVSRIFWGFWSPSCPCIYQSHVPWLCIYISLSPPSYWSVPRLGGLCWQLHVLPESAPTCSCWESPATYCTGTPKSLYLLGQGWVSSAVLTPSAAPWQGCPLAAPQLPWAPTRYSSSCSEPCGENIGLNRSKERRSWGWDSRRTLNTLPSRNMFWHCADQDTRTYNLLHATAHTTQNTDS